MIVLFAEPHQFFRVQGRSREVQFFITTVSPATVSTGTNYFAANYYGVPITVPL